MNDRSDSPTSEAAGSVAEEAVKLMESLGAWASHKAADDPAPNRAGAQECSCSRAQTPAVCQVCPVCRVGAFLEGLSPDIVERLADVVAMFAGSLHAAAQQRRGAAATQSEPEPQADHPKTRKVPVTGDSPDPDRDEGRTDSAE